MKNVSLILLYTTNKKYKWKFVLFDCAYMDYAKDPENLSVSFFDVTLYTWTRDKTVKDNEIIK